MKQGITRLIQEEQNSIEDVGNIFAGKTEISTKRTSNYKK